MNIRHEIELLPSLCPTGEPAVRQVRLRQRALLEVYISSSLHGSGTIFLFVLFPKFFIFGALAEVIVEMDHYDTVVPMHKSQNVKNLREKDQNAKKIRQGLSGFTFHLFWAFFSRCRPLGWAYYNADAG